MKARAMNVAAVSRRSSRVHSITKRVAGLLATATLSIGFLAGTGNAASVTKVYTGSTTTSTFVLRGDIRDGDLARLQAQTAKVPAGQRIALLLDSGGGSIAEGIAIGRYIYATKITTVAIQGPGCHSSCSFVFLAGRDINTEQPSRIMVKGAKVGFHQGRISELPDRSYTAQDINTATQVGQVIVKQVNAYFAEIKADPEFLTLFLSAPNSTVTLLNELDALRLGIYVMEPLSKKLLTPDQFAQQTAR